VLERTSGLWQIETVNVNELRRLLQASPFRPLTLRMGSNKMYSIPHPEFAALSPEGETLVVWLSRKGGADLLDVALIESVEVRKRASARS
jgi:hypothetical protein